MMRLALPLFLFLWIPPSVKGLDCKGAAQKCARHITGCGKVCPAGRTPACVCSRCIGPFLFCAGKCASYSNSTISFEKTFPKFFTGAVKAISPKTCGPTRPGIPAVNPVAAPVGPTALVSCLLGITLLVLWLKPKDKQSFPRNMPAFLFFAVSWRELTAIIPLFFGYRLSQVPAGAQIFLGFMLTAASLSVSLWAFNLTMNLFLIVVVGVRDIRTVLGGKLLWLYINIGFIFPLVYSASVVASREYTWHNGVFFINVSRALTPTINWLYLVITIATLLLALPLNAKLLRMWCSKGMGTSSSRGLDTSVAMRTAAFSSLSATVTLFITIRIFGVSAGRGKPPSGGGGPPAGGGSGPPGGSGPSGGGGAAAGAWGGASGMAAAASSGASGAAAALAGAAGNITGALNALTNATTGGSGPGGGPPGGFGGGGSPPALAFRLPDTYEIEGALLLPSLVSLALILLFGVSRSLWGCSRAAVYGTTQNSTIQVKTKKVTSTASRMP